MTKNLKNNLVLGTTHARIWRIYHEGDSVYGLTTLFPEKDNTGQLRKFQMSRWERESLKIVPIMDVGEKSAHGLQPQFQVRQARQIYVWQHR